MLAQDWSLGVGKMRKPGQGRDSSISGDLDRVTEQVSRQVFDGRVVRVQFPILLGEHIHPPHACLTLRTIVSFLKTAKVLIPQGHSEAVDVTPR